MKFSFNILIPFVKGVIDPAKKLGVRTFNVMGVTDKSFTNAQQFTNELYWNVYKTEQGLAERIILNVAFDFHFNLTQANKDKTPEKFTDVSTYSNRWFPADVAYYTFRMQQLINALQAWPDMWQTITWDLSWEPNADRYWFDTFDNWKAFMAVKLQLFLATGRPLIAPHTTTRLLNDAPGNKPEYMDFINTAEMFNHPKIGFSTSLYWNTNPKNGVPGLFSGAYWPTRSFNEIVVVETNWSTSIKTRSGEKWDTFQSPAMMRYFIDLLKWSEDHGVGTLSFHTLYQHYMDEDHGMLAAWTKKAGVWIAYPWWKVFTDFFSVAKGPHAFTSTGMVGGGKEIEIVGDNYIVKN